MPLVTVVTPCYNGAKYLAETMDSVIAQSFTDWEMIVVDDCSKDNSVDIIKEYSKKDSRIKYMCTPHNTGAPAMPRNIGIEVAKGKYIALLDADDLWTPDKLMNQVTTMEEKGYDMMYSNGTMIDEDGKFIRTIVKQRSVDYWHTLMKNELSCSSTIIRKSILGDTLFKTMPKEDFVFWLELMKKTGTTAYNTNKSEYAYRIISGSRSRNKSNIIKQQWFVLRNVEKLSLPIACYCFLRWALRNIKKYYI